MEWLYSNGLMDVTDVLESFYLSIIMHNVILLYILLHSYTLFFYITIIIEY